MNTSDITCVKTTEQSNKHSSSQRLNEELEVLNSCVCKNGNNWYNRIYLCYEDVPHNQPNASLAIEGFNCYKYNSFTNADYGWNNHIQKLNKTNIRVTMIPMCKWVPQIFDKYILNWKLRNMYWLGKHTIGQGYNYSKK